MPVGYGIFLGVAQQFLNKPNNVSSEDLFLRIILILRRQYGIGQPTPIPSLQDQFDGSHALVWVDATEGGGVPSPTELMAHITASFTPKQLNSVRQVASTRDACPQNFNLLSECFAGIVFYEIPANSSGLASVDYTIRADLGLNHIDVITHDSDFERRILPLQWAIDQVIFVYHRPLKRRLIFSNSAGNHRA